MERRVGVGVMRMLPSLAHGQESWVIEAPKEITRENRARRGDANNFRAGGNGFSRRLHPPLTPARHIEKDTTEEFQPVNIQKSSPVQVPAFQRLKGEDKQPKTFDKSSIPLLGDFYEEHPRITHMAGGALMGAGLARLVGLPSEAILGAAGSGAVGGFFAGSSTERAVTMAGGAAVGATIAALASAPGAAVMGAATTGAVIGYLFG